MADRIQAVLDKESSRIVGRFMKDVDLFGGIKEVCKRFDLEAAQFQCIGSLSHATYVQLEKTSEGVLQYSKKIISDSPVELLSGTGFVGLGSDGELDVHFHGMFVDCHQQISGGHFLDGENPVAITIEFILFPLKDIELKRGNDLYSNLPVFQFSMKE
ncbi:PCC domain-containing protein [Psychrobacillus vulpis]|uniref:PCC domain-containing protein n=1 Tax=Psychrobacillus vulpis TaxID=2325572 RepID=UPI001F0DE2E5|nr:PPC domain-containing DNA-binding protein [Psychrobacillus vulpis]